MAGRKLVLWFVIVVVAALVIAPVLSAKRKLHMARVSACGKREKNAFQNIKLSGTKDENQKLNGDLIVMTNLTNVAVTAKVIEETMDVVTGKKDSQLKLDITNYSDFCNEDLGNEIIWMNITKGISNINKKCPILAGNYSIVDAPLNLNPFAQKFHLTKGSWNISLVFANKDDGAEKFEKFACLEFEFTFLLV